MVEIPAFQESKLAYLTPIIIKSELYEGRIQLEPYQAPAISYTVTWMGSHLMPIISEYLGCNRLEQHPQERGYSIIQQ